MAQIDIDFEGTTTVDDKPTNNGNEVVTEDVTPINGGGNDDITSKDGSKTTNDNTDSSTGEFEVGTQIEFDGATYTVADNGDLVDANGQVFKPAAEVKDWVNSMTQTTEDEVLSIDAIKEAFDVEITDENGNAVEFTNDVAGVKAYVDSVINLKSKELQEGAINKLFNDNPMLQQFIDYVQLNGSPKGFGDIPDRSGIQLDPENAQQHEAIVRMAAREFGNKTISDSYIKYLTDTGALYDEAKAQLSALVEKDKAFLNRIKEEAAAARQKEQDEVVAYWKNVNNVINNRNIAGYKLPESFVKEVNGQKITLTPNDFYNYLSKASEVDEAGNKMTKYQSDLNNLTDAEVLNRELLDAWLMFTGGTYKDLIDMAVKEDKVRTLRLKSKEQRTNKTVKIVKPNNGKANINDIIL